MEQTRKNGLYTADKDELDEWYKKQGQAFPERYYKLSQKLSEVPSFDKNVLQEH